MSGGGLEAAQQLHPHFHMFSLLSRWVFTLLSPQVDKVCGLSTEEPTGMQPPASTEVTTSAITSSPPLPSAAPSQGSPEKWLKQIAYLKR